MYFRVRSTHDSCQCDDALAVGDGQHRGVELAHLAVESRQLLTMSGAAHHDAPAAHQLEVEGVKRLAELEQHVIGCVDHTVDRTNTAVPKSAPHPLR